MFEGEPIGLLLCITLSLPHTEANALTLLDYEEDDLVILPEEES